MGAEGLGFRTETMVINMGPQHPATHGVLRLILELDGEYVVRCIPDIGYLHRGKEKIAESITYLQWIPYTDRLDYLAPLSNNVGYVMAVEKLLGLEIPRRAQYIRVICCELARIASHLLWLGTHALDIGAATVFFHTFREREAIYDLFDVLTGSRMHHLFPRFGGLANDMPPDFPPRVRAFLETFPEKVAEYETLLTRNRIWVDRTRRVGILSAKDAIALGVTGPNLRASGIEWDLRRAQPYLVYDRLDFEVPIGENGDVYDRYLVRMEEMRQSHRILLQCLEQMPPGPIHTHAPKAIEPPKHRIYTKMEELIHDFKVIVDGFNPPVGEVYFAIEGPRGELGFYIVSDGGRCPLRVKVRSPSFVNLQALPRIVEGRLVADVVACLGSLDPVVGEVDK